MWDCSYLLYLFKSTNKHSVHSPFVYDLLTRCFKQKTPGGLTKNEKHLWQLINYFKWKSIELQADKSSYRNLLKRLSLTLDERAPFKLIEASNIQLPLSRWLDTLEIEPDSCIFIEGIHKSKKNSALWNELIGDNRVIVSIDRFRFGIVFFRKEQLKQHFILRF